MDRSEVIRQDAWVYTQDGRHVQIWNITADDGCYCSDLKHHCASTLFAAPPPPAEQASGELAEARELLAAELDAIRFPAMAAEVRDPEGYNSCGAAMVRAVASALSHRPVVGSDLNAAIHRAWGDLDANNSAEYLRGYTAALQALAPQQPEKGEGT